MLNNEQRPPYVMFEMRAIIDRQASEANGHATYKDTPFAMITPAGSKDCVEKVAEEWLDQIEQASYKGAYPIDWVPRFKQAFEMWKKGEEVPPHGTPLKMWPQITPAELMMCKGANVLTVEDLAEANEQLLQRIGMIGRVLKNKAEAWLKASTGGKVSEEIAALKEENRRLQEQNESLNEKMNRVLAQMGDEPKRRGRPPTNHQEAA